MSWQTGRNWTQSAAAGLDTINGYFWTVLQRRSQFRALNHVHAIPIDVKGTRAWVRNEITGIAAQGYEVMHLKIPERVLKIEKIRSDESVCTQNFAGMAKSA